MSLSTVRLLGLCRPLPLPRCTRPSARLFSVGLHRVSQHRPAFSRTFATQPPPAPIPLADASPDSLGITDTLVHQIPPLAYGDFAALGLSSWSPIGLLAWSFELIHVSTSLPWLYTIILGSAACRLFCVPFALANIRSSTRLRPYQDAVAKARERITAAQTKRDAIELQRASMAMKKIYADANVNPFTGMILPMVAQLPVTIGMFFALRRICSSGIEQLRDGGAALSLDLPWTGPVELFADLSAADPTYILPVAFCAMINAQIMVGAREMDMQTPATGHFMNLFRGLSVLTVFFMSSFPQGLFVGLLTTSVLTVAQSLALRSDVVRRLVRIPVVKREVYGKLPTFVESFRYGKKMLEDKQKVAVVSAAQQHGRGAIRRAPPPKKL